MINHPPSKPTTILTGLQPTGSLHIGNYFGGLKPLITKAQNLKNNDRLFLFVPDLHSFTIELDYHKQYQLILDTIKMYLATGLDYKKDNIYIYRQSFISAHSEIQWLLSCFSYFGEMSKMTQFKDKSQKNTTNINVGLFNYPILMAGDILLYDANYVPVGDDQKQHIELTRDLAIRINNKFNQQIFTVPENWQKQLDFMKMEEGLRIRSLVDPEKKMSKSDTSEKSKILLSDDPKAAIKKIMSATTDNFGEINWNWEKQAGVTNLLQILTLLTDSTKQEICDTWCGQSQYGNLKKAVATEIERFLIDFQSKYSSISDLTVEQTLRKNEEQVKIIANNTLNRFQKALGLRNEQFK
jgi:tryptophanyl-tRNA synthetase